MSADSKRQRLGFVLGAGVYEWLTKASNNHYPTCAFLRLPATSSTRPDKTPVVARTSLPNHVQQHSIVIITPGERVSRLLHSPHI